MIPYILAAFVLVAPLVSLGVVALAAFVGAKISSGEFSWLRYAAWLVGAAVGAVFMLAARTSGVFLSVAVVLVLWVLLRAAADAQSTTLREKVGFVQLYAGLSLVEYGAMSRAGMIQGSRTSPAFTFVLHDYLGQLTLPLSGALSQGGGRSAALVGSVANALAEHWMTAVALATFGVAALAYAYFAEHATPRVGVDLLPGATAVTLVFAGLVAARIVLPATSMPGTGAALGVAFLLPFFAAEGLWVIHRFAGRLRSRSVWTLFLAGSSLVLPALASTLAAIGFGFHLVRLRAFEPILGDVRRSSTRPRLRTAAAVSLAASALFVVLGAAEAATLQRLSPKIRMGPDACGGVTFSPSGGSVVVSGPAGTFTIDADETPLGQGATFESARAICKARQARPCTSDEWQVACVCTYPNESLAGSKTTTNDRLVYRLDSDHEGANTAEVRGLLTGATEVVEAAVPFGGVLSAGPNDGVPDAFTADCRYRSFLTDRALSSPAGALTAVRCCH